MKFKVHELPIAYSMMAAESRVRPRRDGRHPYDKYFLLWTAFSNIYTAIAARKGHSTELIVREDGTVETCPNGNVKIPRVKTVSESERINLALEAFDEALKQSLIQHESTRYFAERTPFWEGSAIEQDAFGQRVNGVINVDYTTSADYPVWSPIDLQMYARYLAQPDKEEDRDFLVKQIVELLYTVSKNLMYFGRKFNDANDIAVIEKALPLLRLMVSSFTQ